MITQLLTKEWKGKIKDLNVSRKSEIWATEGLRILHMATRTISDKDCKEWKKAKEEINK